MGFDDGDRRTSAFRVTGTSRVADLDPPDLWTQSQVVLAVEGKSVVIEDLQAQSGMQLEKSECLGSAQ